MADEDYPDALPARYRLHWFVIERVLGQGGFGITYLAHDTNLDRRVAIKEYLPTEVARRRSDASARPRTETHNERYAWGLERFLAEARTLARFDHPNIVRVLSVFEANNTAYMVMRFEEGEDLATLLDRRGTLPEEQLVSLTLPVLEGLQLIHASGFIHRDIKPENIYVRQDGSPVLLDFGSARQSFGSAKTMTILVAPGYAPLEQYYGDAKSQGAWTDIYGLGATCYRAIAGRAPLDAIARAKGVLGSTHDILQPAGEVGRGRYSQRLLDAIDHALQLSERNRPQTIAEWRSEIVAPPPGPAVVVPTSVEASVVGAAAAPLSQAATTTEPAAAATALAAANARATFAGSRWAWATVAGVCAVAATAAYVSWSRKGPGADMALPPTTAPSAEAPSTPVAPRLAAAEPVAPPSPSPAKQAASTSMVAPPRSSPETVAAAQPSPVIVTKGPPAPIALPSDRRGREARASIAPPPRETGPSSIERPSKSIAVAERVSPPVVNAPMPAASVPPPLPQATTMVTTPPAPAIATLAVASTKRIRDEQLEAADAALRRGDFSGAIQVLTPLAAAGVPRAQAMLGRAQEGRPAAQRSDFEAYVWYSIAARNGEPGAAASRDKLAGRLQPAEVRQAEHIAERWKASGESSTTTQERSSP